VLVHSPLLVLLLLWSAASSCGDWRCNHALDSRTNPAISRAIALLKADGALWRFARLRQYKHLMNTVEQDHRRVKRLVTTVLEFGGMRAARQTWRATRQWR
jgi:transposase-like protein